MKIPAATRRFRLLWFVCLIFISGLTGWYITQYLGNLARQEIMTGNEASTTILSIHITTEFRKLEGTVKALAGSPWIAPALMTRRTGDIDRASSVLVRYNEAVGATVSYLMDITGMTIASSNWREPDSFVGHSYAFRPYFQAALQGNPFSYLARGITSRERGFYSSTPVRNAQGRIVGVVAIKKELREIEANMRKYPYCFLVDKNGIIFLASNPEMVFRSLWPVKAEVEKSLLASRQFGDQRFVAVMDREVNDGMEAVFAGKQVLVSRKPVNISGWSIILMASGDRITAYRLTGVLIGALVFLLLIAILLLINYRISRYAEIIRQNEAQLITEQKKYHYLLDNSPFGVVVLSQDGTFSYINPKFHELFGYDIADIPNGRTWFRKAYPDPERRKKAIAAWREDTRELAPGEKMPRLYAVTCKDGTEKMAHIITVKLESGDCLLTFEDRTELHRYQENLEYFAIHDALTGLLNRRSLTDMLNRAIARAKRGTASALLYMDLDNFKDVNDTVGHRSGDGVLITLAGLLREAVRTGDTVFRMGGDEFAALLDGINSSGEAFLVAERLRVSIEAHRFELNQRVFRLSLSIGLAEINGNEAMEDIIVKADNAMYQAKEQGKNRIILALAEEGGRGDGNGELLRSRPDQNG